MGILSVQPDLFCCALAWQGWSQLTRNTLMWIQQVFLVLSCQRVKYTDVDAASVALFCLDRGGYSRPKYTDVLWVQLVLLPYYIVHYICWWVRWVWLFNIRRQEYGEEEKLHLIRKYMKCTKSQWDVSMHVCMFVCVCVVLQGEMFCSVWLILCFNSCTSILSFFFLNRLFSFYDFCFSLLKLIYFYFLFFLLFRPLLLA